jgi:hypothetical protein
MKYFLLTVLTVYAISGCTLKKEQVLQSDFPFPADSDLVYYQAQCDSGFEAFWLDIKATSSAFVNQSRYYGYSSDTDDMRILGEGIFHGQVEVEMKDFILVITLERQFKEKGRRAIWQVVDAKEKPWPKRNSKSEP